MALKLAEEQAKREQDEQKEEEANNPMKLLGMFYCCICVNTFFTFLRES